MNEQIRRAAENVLSRSKQSQEYKRRLLRLLENVPTGNYTDGDVKQVVDLATSQINEES